MRWRLLWNANLDKAEKNQRTKAALLKELRAWEDTLKTKKDYSVKDTKEYTVIRRLFSLPRGLILTD
jgi:hypothetical protein